MKIKLVTVKILLILSFFITLPMIGWAQQKTIAITIDDLPFVGEYRNFHLNMIVTAMKEQQVPATGFIIAREVRHDNWEALRKFREAGFGLGNHTLSHANLNKLDINECIHEIKEADSILQPVLTKPKYFRYPYLAMGTGSKKNKILCYLASKNYQVAPITIDSKDFAFNQRLFAVPEINRRAYLDELKPFYLDFIWQQTVKAEEHRNTDQAQILLIHANLLNAYVLPDIIKLYKEKGYTFVTLEKALKTFKSPQCPSLQLAKQEIKKKSANLEKPNTDTNIENFVDWD
ncbi:polysaccharide deacetylase family protein [Legionella fallonii]|uniref:Polysaccharide deacetylase n=1 Tax=Legionella fallonii LLAP-10 TaxID=1212491 RepID=A0A098G7S3_9GAMM|nr:polysaccharide deacetylase family protein [Legionella fallonii]CEG58503.1 Polysaccharide deacetylase [Legionella fallonii LLAP-10]